MTNEEVLDEVGSDLNSYLECAEAVYKDALKIEKQIDEVYKHPQKKLLNAWLKEPACEQLTDWKERSVEWLHSGIVDVYDSLEEAIMRDEDCLPYRVMVSQAVSLQQKVHRKHSTKNNRKFQRGRNRQAHNLRIAK